MNDYQGEERRRRPVRGQDDHDTLTELNVNVTQIAEDLKEFMKKFDDHVKEDSDGFKTINRYVFVGFGIVIALRFVVPLIYK